MPAAMAGRIRSSQGCWTCRLRRKKCDEAKPRCGVCGALEITCVYGEQKPAWMDGGAREKAKAAELRAMVKAKAGERRDRKWARELGGDAGHAVDDLDGMLSRSMAGGMALEAAGGDGDENGYGHGESNGNTSNDVSAVAISGNHQFGDAEQHTGDQATMASSGASAPPASWLVDNAQERELTQVMLYLDYVFPFLNPFYQPALLAHGRGWLLVLLTRNRALFHAALSLASYFLAVVIENAAAGHESCRARNWELLIQQQGCAAAALHADLAALDLAALDRQREGEEEQQQQQHLGCTQHLRAAVACLNTMAHMLSFELAVGNAASGPAHLDAAAGLLDQLVAHARRTGDGAAAPWHAILARLGPQDLPADVTWPGAQRPWLSDEAAFRFVTAQLLWTDVLAATARGRAPRLQALHAELLAGPDPGLPLHEFVGVQSWAVALLGEVAALAAGARTEGPHPMRPPRPADDDDDDDELARRARDIETRLEDGVAALERTLPPDGRPPPAHHDPSASAPGSQPSAPPLPIAGASGPGASTPAAAAHAFHTLVYVRATLLYLATVAHGWAPAHPAVRRHHARLVALLGALPGPLCLRTLVWPFAVAGCLARPDQEPFFRGLVAAMDEGLRVFGTVREALRVMTVVWEHRGGRVGAVGWGLAECLGVLGHGALLV